MRPSGLIIVAGQKFGKGFVCRCASIDFFLLDVFECCVFWWSSAPTFSVEGLAASKAFDIHFQDRGMVHEAVDGGECHSLVRENFAPLSEGLVGRNEQRPALITCSDQLEQDTGLRLIFGKRRRYRPI